MYNHLFAPAIGRKLGIALMLLLIEVSRGYAQEWTFQAGMNVSHFSFTNTSGIPLSGIKLGSGNSLGIQYHQNWVDTASLLIKSNPTAIFINQRPGLAKLLSRFRWGLGIHLNQYNAVGDAVNTSYSYLTNYLGIMPSLQFKQKLYKGLFLLGAGHLLVSRLVQGNQWVNNRFMDLRDDVQFNGFQSMIGYQLGLTQQVNENLQMSINYTRSTHMAPIASQGTNLSIQSSGLVFGIIIQPKSK